MQVNKGMDADIGLTDWTLITGKVCVIDTESEIDRSLSLPFTRSPSISLSLSLSACRHHLSDVIRSARSTGYDPLHV